MSRCNNCLQGYCRKHPLQDHGERELSLKAKAKNVQQQSLLDLLQTEIKKLEASAVGTSNSEIESYKSNMIAERSRAEKVNSYRESSMVNNYVGLNPSVALMMQKNEFDDESNTSTRKRSITIS